MSDHQSVASDINDGYVPIYVTKLVLKLRKEGEEAEEAEKIPKETVFKIFVRQDNDVLESVRFQISDDKRLNFLYEADYDLDSFQSIKEEQELEIEFDDFPNVIRQLISTIIKQGTDELNEGDYKASFKDRLEDEENEDSENQEEEQDGESKTRYLVISQRLEFCSVAIFTLVFHECDNARVEHISQYRYDEISQKLKAVETEYKDIYKRIQRQAPKLLQDYKPSTTEA
ncbi:hypothetical protein TRFO_31273 [Tritrichomonas foetus]|uniref:Spindle assembly abnormal protein 6 N-terminal domain-containing protein n=1 Tax=Tritrichomonas foetus TaxID=1144522 RepID=A0A1J4JRL6_9EUKA|nr:hypothetical protein TRFO_31273 [Tritrichomonas foetus]|eukprot:OHT01761.1 hypothetical protein TRFO_31273 [Tritrichomonas foetus]